MEKIVLGEQQTKPIGHSHPKGASGALLFSLMDWSQAPAVPTSGPHGNKTNPMDGW